MKAEPIDLSGDNPINALLEERQKQAATPGGPTRQRASASWSPTRRSCTDLPSQLTHDRRAAIRRHA
jgi:hypothetical protein